jgi:hypothetical protein
MMEPVEAGRLELAQSIGNDAAPRRHCGLKSVPALDVQTVGEEMSPSKAFGVLNQLVERQTNRRIVRSDNRAGARADDRVDRNAVPNQRSKHADVARSAQPTRAEHNRDTTRDLQAAISPDCSSFTIVREVRHGRPAPKRPSLAASPAVVA